MVLTKVVLTCAMLVAGQTGSDLVYTNLRSGRIPPVINPDRSADIRELQLYMSPDKGRTWNQVDKITPDKDGFGYSVPSDGEYWYQVVLVNKQGKQEPADLHKAMPMMKLVVDTKPPELKITSAQRQGDELVVTWVVREDNPDPPKLKMEYRASDSNIWTPMQLTPAPQGTAKVKLNSAAQLVVRLQFTDLANNNSSVEAQVTGGIAMTGYNPPAAPSGPTDPLAAPALGAGLPTSPPVAPVAPAGTDKPGTMPPAPPGQNAQPQASIAPAPPASAPVPRGAAIANSADLSQGSPVPTQSPNQPSQRGMPQLQMVNDPEIVVEYEVSKVGPSGMGKIEVWMTRDGGASWIRFAEDPDANQATSGGQYKRTLTLPGEGIYGISLVVKSKAGIGRPGPRPGDTPEMLIEVDSTPPEAKLFALTPDSQRRDMVVLNWLATDKNLTTTPITLEWSEKAAGPWQPIAANLPNSGRYPWLLPKSLPSHVYLRLTVRDTAGNEAVAVTRDPQLVDLSEPEGHLLRVLPANKKQ